MKPLPHWPVHTWMGLAGLLGGILGSWEADGVAAGFGLNLLRWTGCWWFGRQYSRMTRMMDGIYKTHEWKNMFGILQRTGIWSYNLTRAEPCFQREHQAQALWAAFIPYLQIAPSVRKATWEVIVGLRAGNQDKGTSKNTKDTIQSIAASMLSRAWGQRAQLLGITASLPAPCPALLGLGRCPSSLLSCSLWPCFFLGPYGHLRPGAAPYKTCEE